VTRMGGPWSCTGRERATHDRSRMGGLHRPRPHVGGLEGENLGQEVTAVRRGLLPEGLASEANRRGILAEFKPPNPGEQIGAVVFAAYAALAVTAEPSLFPSGRPSDESGWALCVDATKRTALSAIPSEGRLHWAEHPAVRAAESSEMLHQASLARDISGPLPFRPVAIHPHVLAWNDRLVIRLAQAIYDERRWGDMPLLGDALMDSGCDNEEILAHCRSGGDHVRGCWVVDLLLGKE
jgi:hypothetical protein